MFGTVFNDITIKRIHTNLSEAQSFKVPISYGPTKKYLAILDERNLGADDDGVSITLPRMSFEIMAMNYDGTRKLQRTKRHSKVIGSDNTKLISAYTPVPYNFEIELNIMVKNSDDGAQIIEQIMPYFSPEFHVTLNEMSTLGMKRDIPIILNSIPHS